MRALSLEGWGKVTRRRAPDATIWRVLPADGGACGLACNEGKEPLRRAKENKKSIVLSVLAVIVALIAAAVIGVFALCQSWLQDLPDYTNADEVWNCRLSTMWDINTGSDRVPKTSKPNTWRTYGERRAYAEFPHRLRKTYGSQRHRIHQTQSS